MIVGRHALVTGGGSGIGRAIALALAEAGVLVTICGRRREALDAVVHDRIHGIVADVTDPASLAALYAEAQAARGDFDIVIANAGRAEGTPAAKITQAAWRASLDTNLTGAFLTVQPALAAMTAARRGRIVFVASTAGLKGYAYTAAYTAAKHGVVGLMRALAAETVKSGVTVNAVCPGFTETDMLTRAVGNIEAATGRNTDAARAALANPQGGFVTPEEVAGTVLWLVSDAAASVTGQAIAIAGGET